MWDNLKVSQTVSNSYHTTLQHPQTLSNALEHLRNNLSRNERREVLEHSTNCSRNEFTTLRMIREHNTCGDDEGFNPRCVSLRSIDRSRVNRESMRVYASNWSMPAPMLPFAGSSRGKLVTHICTEVYLSWILASDAYTAREPEDPAILDPYNSLLPNDYAFKALS